MSPVTITEVVARDVLWARREGKPLWKLLVDIPPAQLVSCLDFSYITDALTPDQALDILNCLAPTRAEREQEMRRDGYPAFLESNHNAPPHARGAGAHARADDGREPVLGRGEAIRQMKALARFDPWWIEEPTSPDDVLGHAATEPGNSITMRPESLAAFEFPSGREWSR